MSDGRSVMGEGMDRQDVCEWLIEGFFCALILTAGAAGLLAIYAA